MLNLKYRVNNFYASLQRESWYDINNQSPFGILIKKISHSLITDRINSFCNLTLGLRAMKALKSKVRALMMFFPLRLISLSIVRLDMILNLLYDFHDRVLGIMIPIFWLETKLWSIGEHKWLKGKPFWKR